MRRDSIPQPPSSLSKEGGSAPRRPRRIRHAVRPSLLSGEGLSRGTRDGEESTPPRFGYALLLRRLLALRAECYSAQPAGHAAPDALDRRVVLRRLAAELGAAPDLLLARGFDKAYRRAVEGL